MEQIDVIQEVSQNFIDSAYDVNTNRAFPDARDGLKPGQRCCLWEMYKKGYSSNKPHVKSAKVSGGVAASWWPHGTTAIYETFARMSQPFTNNIPEIDFHGANGNIILGGDSIAADRYTEVRLAKMTEEGMLSGIEKKCVDMTLNFSEDEEMPTVLPSVFPRLLVNGCQGIGVSVANYWLPYNFKEVADMLCHYISTDEVKDIYPDFPTGGVIINKNEILKINQTGKGKVLVEAKYTIVGNEIRFTEFPFQVYIEPLIEEIKEGVSKDKIHNIREVLNKSDKKQTLLTIECINKEKIPTTLEELFSNTGLRSQYNANQMAIVGKTPTLLTMKDVCEIYTAHNLSCIKKQYEFDLEKTLKRIEIIEGLLKALENIDRVVLIIKSSSSTSEAQTSLQKEFGFSERQVKSILDMRLSKLSHLEKDKLEKELKEKLLFKEECERVINNEDQQREILKERLEKLSNKYGEPRRSQIEQKEIAKKIKGKKEKNIEKVCIIIDDRGYIKNIPITSYKPQANCIGAVRTDTSQLVLLLTNKGRLFRVKTSSIKQCGNNDKGTAAGAILPLAEEEKILCLLDNNDDNTFVFIMKNNYLGKKMKKSTLTGTTQNLRGMKYIPLEEKEKIINVSKVEDDDEMVCISKSGKAGRFCMSDFTANGTTGKGVRTLKPEENCEIIYSVCGKNKRFQVLFSNKEKENYSFEDIPLRRKGNSVGIWKKQEILKVKTV